MTGKVPSTSTSSAEPRVSVLSLRHVEKLVARTVNFEFEDRISDMDSAEILHPRPGRGFELRKRAAHRAWRHLPAKAATLNPGLEKESIAPGSEVFVAVCMNIWDLVYLNGVEGWRDPYRIKICWIDEIWKETLSQFHGLMPLLSQFDYVFIGCHGTVKPLQDLIRKPVVYLPPGVDAIRFCPWPDPPHRAIDVYSIGRRSEVTHRALLGEAAANRLFYMYDTVSSSTMSPARPEEHRQLVASLAKRSRYFIANTAKINLTSETRGQNEVGFRFFEGAASGSIMIGQPPQVETFEQNFDWPDAVIPMPFDAPDIIDFLADLDRQNQRLETARRNNAVQSLLRHDWAWRWRAILDTVGLSAAPGLERREQRLKQLATVISNARPKLVAGKMQSPA